MKVKIYERIYDNPKDVNGKPKPNKSLGTYEVEGGLPDDYSYTVYGIKDKKLYQIDGVEISYSNGGTKHYIIEITEDHPLIKAWKKLNKLN